MCDSDHRYVIQSCDHWETPLLHSISIGNARAHESVPQKLFPRLSCKESCLNMKWILEQKFYLTVFQSGKKNPQNIHLLLNMNLGY